MLVKDKATEQSIDLAPLADALKDLANEEGAIIAMLQATQDLYGYLPTEALEYVSATTGRSLAQLYGVATFYAQFTLEPRGRHVVQLCDGTACHVSGMPAIVSALETDLGIRAGETTEDGRVTLDVVFCVGSCGLAPVAIIDGQVVGRMVPDKAVKMVRELE